MSDSDRRAHWDQVYRTRGEAGVSWYEATPALSLALLREAGLTPEMAVIDVGGGLSRLAETLAAAGQAHVTVLDLSAAALEAARARLGDAGGRLRRVAADVTAWTPDRRYALWHDRAAFHFLTAAAEQQAYAATLAAALEPGGRAVIGTFAPDGPERCSGLPVARHDAESLRAILGAGFRLLATRRHEHVTPWGSVQRFQFATFEKLPATP